MENLDILQIINKKSLNKELNENEINFFVKEYALNKIPDYQASALLMAIKINGMTKKETFALTKAMLYSGEILNLNDIGTVVDKHSTGGVSDSTSIAIAPICACCGVKMLKLSGRGLGHTGGTIDKLEAFDGYDVDIPMTKAKKLLKTNGACIISSSKNLAPADKKLYALRDVTSCVESLPLIASSIMSKKLASGSHAIVLDVKYGDGAFMKTKSSAKKLAKLMCEIGKNFGKKMDFVISNMNQPLGNNIGNKLEAFEVIEILNGKKGKLYESIVNLSARCVKLGLGININQAKEKVTYAIKSKNALTKLKTMIKAQGGSLDLFDGLKIKPVLKITSTKQGKITKIYCQELGSIVGKLGAGRSNLTDKIDYNVGIKTYFKQDQKIQKGQLLYEIFMSNKSEAKKHVKDLLNCIEIK